MSKTEQPHKRYSSHKIHELLIARCISQLYNEVHADEDRGFIGAQALVCPYYVTLSGRLGSDWGVIVNPESSRFGLLTFEHDDCGCPKHPDEEDDGQGRHNGSDCQKNDLWFDPVKQKEDYETWSREWDARHGRETQP